MMMMVWWVRSGMVTTKKSIFGIRFYGSLLWLGRWYRSGAMINRKEVRRHRGECVMGMVELVASSS